MTCEVNCCKPQAMSLSATVGGNPLYDASCCAKGMAFAPVAGMVAPAGSVVFFTGNDVTIDGVPFPEVDIAGADVAGIALWDVDNTAGTSGSNQFLVEARVFTNRLTLNGATLAQLRAVGLIAEHVSA